MELDFLSPRAREINKKRLSLLYSLKNQNIEQNDPINENVPFIQKLSSDHPLKDVIKECQNNVREGFLTPLTNRSSNSLEFTANMFVEELLDSIKIKHLKILQLDELINNLKNNIEILHKIDANKIFVTSKEYYQIFILNQPNDDNYQLYLNDQKLYPQIKYTCPFDAKQKLNFALFSSNNKMLEAISVDMIYQICHNCVKLESDEYLQTLQIRFFEDSNNPIIYDLKISLVFNMTRDFKKTIINTLKEEIKEIDYKILDMIEVINRMLEPFSNNGFKYLRYEGLIDNQSMSKNRNHCCSIF
ncbi:unnamed protein product (macronuclear) [Paramecium tetraurelia]|uniref:Uncharacterized protein n=1 Tax=Paramecium tetraurelia TaxID=5888 RepID=A0D9P7_PARTE|nr:uncharacterized protein GSPATT00014695001 [Paramecium tetraurelia]CAK79764.1 unnamed protein product [Paramecium tetraurelia]|eukprot:XP_001447161.1 hypothetical protein (macronuclear) [Paramecium tetraurelia strain d4-2]